MSFSVPLAQRKKSGLDCLSVSEFPGRPQRALGTLKRNCVWRALLADGTGFKPAI